MTILMATKDTSYKFIVKQMTYLGNVDGVNCGLRKFEFREGSHVNSGPASIVLSDLKNILLNPTISSLSIRHLVQFSLKLSVGSSSGINKLTASFGLLVSILLDLLREQILKVTESQKGKK